MKSLNTIKHEVLSIIKHKETYNQVYDYFCKQEKTLKLETSPITETPDNLAKGRDSRNPFNTIHTID